MLVDLSGFLGLSCRTRTEPEPVQSGSPIEDVCCGCSGSKRCLLQNFLTPLLGTASESKQLFRKRAAVSDESAASSSGLISVAFGRRYGRHHQINKLLSGAARRFSRGLIKHLHTDAWICIVAGDDLDGERAR